jgi:hypothetical protein
MKFWCLALWTLKALEILSKTDHKRWTKLMHSFKFPVKKNPLCKLSDIVSLEKDVSSLIILRIRKQPNSLAKCMLSCKTAAKVHTSRNKLHWVQTMHSNSSMTWNLASLNTSICSIILVRHSPRYYLKESSHQSAPHKCIMPNIFSTLLWLFYFILFYSKVFNVAVSAYTNVNTTGLMKAHTRACAPI